MTQRESIATWPTDRANRINAKLVETLTGTRAITLAEIEQYQAFAMDPGGAARDVTLPAAAACKGAFILFTNEADAAEVITIKDAAAATLVTPTTNEAGILWCDGVSWFGFVGASS